MYRGKAKKSFFSFFLYDDKRMQKQLFYLEILLGAISFVMSVINVITQQKWLLLSTAFMAVFSLVNAFIISRGDKFFTFAKVIFCVKMLVLFTYFIVFGGTEGFSTIWLLLLPACGLFVFGRKEGTILSLLLLAELVILFYTPLRDVALQCEYTDAFLMRFPVVYGCFFAVGYYLEYIRELTYNEMNRLRKEARDQAQHDAMTGLYNRYGFDIKLGRYFTARQSEPFALLLIDTDMYKTINDKYGHTVGDNVLKIIANRIGGTVSDNGIVCRWGGDEFAVLIHSKSFDEWKSLAEEIRMIAAQKIITDGHEIFTTISIGGVESGEISSGDATVMAMIADERLYRAKTEGRNQCVLS